MKNLLGILAVVVIIALFLFAFALTIVGILNGYI